MVGFDDGHGIVSRDGSLHFGELKASPSHGTGEFVIFVPALLAAKDEVRDLVGEFNALAAASGFYAKARETIDIRLIL